MATFSSASKSNRLLQSKRYTLADFDSQEAYTRVLDLNASEIYTQQGSLPSTSATLPYSGSSQDGLFITSGSGANEVNIARYYYQIELSPTETVTSGKLLTWFTISGSTSDIGYDNPVSPQVVQPTQMTNWVSNKYITAADAANKAETPGQTVGQPGYNVYVRKGNDSSTATKVDDNDIVFDYKTGVLQWMNASNAPDSGNATNNRMYLSGYQYVGKTLDQFVASGSGGEGVGFPFSGSAIITGSLLVSGSDANDEPVLTISGSTVLEGDITASGAIFTSASIDNLTVSTVISGSTIITSGSNTLGDATNDVQTLIGTVKVSGSLEVSGSATFVDTVSLPDISDVSASIAALESAEDNAGIFSETSVTGIFETTSSLQVTGSTLLETPVSGSNPTSANDGTSSDVAKYAMSVSESVWAYNHNVGVPKSNAWQTGLDGSYFDKFNHNTDTSEILRFIAGLLKDQAPSSSPNTRLYGAVSQSSITNNSAGSRPSGRVPQSYNNSIITYFNGKGFVTEGEQLFHNVSATLKSSIDRVKTFGSDPSGTTTVSSSLTPSGELFGLGTIGSLVTLKSSASFFYSDNSSKTETFSSESVSEITQTGTGGSIIKIGDIETANPSVIPNEFQDGFFEGAFAINQQFDANIDSLAENPSASAGYYHLSQSIALQTGSGAETDYKELNEEIFLISGSLDGEIPNNTLSVSTSNVASTDATSASLSGAPYLLTANYSIEKQISGLFDPMYAGNTTIAQLTENPSDTKVTLDPVSNHSITATINNSGQVSSADSIFPNGGGVARGTVVPTIDDIAILSGSLEFDAGTGGGTSKTNITRTGISSGDGNSQFTIRTTYKNRAGASTNSDTAFEYHTAGTFDQPADSGSLAYYGALQGEINGQELEVGTSIESEDFIGEKYRLRLTDKALSGSYDEGDHVATGSFATYNLGGKDLQVKPGFLIKPGDTSQGYWLEDPDPTAAGQYKYYIRAFKKSATSLDGKASTFAINLVRADNSNNVTLADWGTGTSNGDIACVVLYEYSAIGGGNPSITTVPRLFDMSNLNGTAAGQSSYSANTSATNPFGTDITVAGMAGAATISSGKTTHTLDDTQGSLINNANPNIVVIVRFAAGGGSMTALKRIDVQLS